MTIRQQQIDALSEHRRAEFEHRTMKYLRVSFSDQTQLLDEENLLNLVVQGIGRAESYGIVFESDIQRFLEYMIVLSRDFDTNLSTAWAGDILRSHDTDGTQKMARIDNIYLFSQRGI